MASQCDNTTSTCICSRFRDPNTLCKTVIFEAYNHLDLIYAIIMMAAFFVLLIAYFYEMAMNLKKRRFTPILIAHGAMILFLISRVTLLILWIVSSSLNTDNYAKTTLFINSIGWIILISSHVLIVIGWLDIILMAKNVGFQIKEMRIIKIVLWTLVGIFGTLALIILIVIQLITVLVIMDVALALLLIVVVVSVIIEIVYMVKAFRWIKTQDETPLFIRMKRKGYFVIGLIISLVVMSVFGWSTKPFASCTPDVCIGLEIGYQLIELITATIMLLFLENNLL